MSDGDSFIHEVTEEVRRDRMFRLWKRYAPFVVGGIVAIVGATAVVAWLGGQAEDRARVAGGRLIEASQAEGSGARAAALVTLLETAEGGAALLARMQAAGALVETGETARAADLFAQVADEAAASEPVLAALAAYRAALLRAPDAPHDETVAALGALTAPSNPMRLLALEARGAVHLRAGDVSLARADFDAVLDDPEATEAMQQRVREMRATIAPPPEPSLEG